MSEPLDPEGPLGLPRGHQRFPLFDPLRALAAIAILVVHTAIFSGGINNPVYGRFLLHLDIGVPFFFLLSAFLLYRPFLAARVHGTPRTSFADYALRRFTRIAPAYWLVLTVAAIVPGIAGAFSGDWWAYYGLLQNYALTDVDPGCVASPFRCGLPQTWSLAVEVGFYVALPFYVLAMGAIGRRFGGTRWLPAELWAVLALSVISIAIQSIHPDTKALLRLFYTPLARGWWFGLGFGLAALSVWAADRDREPRLARLIRSSPGPPILAAIALYIVACYLTAGALVTFPVSGQGEYLAQFLLFGVIAALVLLPATFGADGPGLFRRALRHRALVWLGLTSYGIFLWHYPVMLALLDAGILDLWPPMNLLVLTFSTLALTVALSALSYYLLERPLMRLVRRRSAVRPALGTGAG